MTGSLRPDPLAKRPERLVSEALDDELLLYDLDTHRLHSLNSTAREVWSRCDGATPIRALQAALAAELEIAPEQAEQMLWLALEELDEADLLERRPETPLELRRLDRRAWIQRIATLSLLPAVYSIVSPLPASAASLGCVGGSPVCAQCADCPPGTRCCVHNGNFRSHVCVPVAQSCSNPYSFPCGPC